MKKRALWVNQSQTYPLLHGTKKIHTLIVGGGMAGISAAYYCSQKNIPAMLIEKDVIVSGATGHGTGILVPGFDMDFVDMVRLHGKKATQSIRKITNNARKEMMRLARKHHIACGMEETGVAVPILLERDMPLLRKEARLRNACGHRCEIYEGCDIHRVGHMNMQALLYSKDVTLVNQEKFAMGLACASRGVDIYEKTPVMSIKKNGMEYIARTPRGIIHAKKIILIAGGGDQTLIRHSRRVQSCFVFEIATRPLTRKEFHLIAWKKGKSLWPLGRFYDYMRMTSDNRIIVGGEDTTAHVSQREQRNHYKRLRAFLVRIFPQLKDVAIDYEWSGVVHMTRDDVPEIGRRGDIFFGFAYGGHGLCMAFYFGKLLAELAYKGESHRCARHLFNSKNYLSEKRISLLQIVR